MSENHWLGELEGTWRLINTKPSLYRWGLVKAMDFPVVMYGCEGWTIKNTDHWGTDALELWCWRRLMKVPWTARRSNQWILKETSPEYSLEGLMLKLKHQYFGHLMWRTDSLEKTLMPGKIEVRRRRGWQRIEMVGWHHQLDGHEFEQASGAGEGQGSPARCSPWGRKESHRVVHDWVTELNLCILDTAVLGTMRNHFWHQFNEGDVCENKDQS